MKNTVWIVFSIFIGIVVFSFLTFMAFKIPGFAGQIFGFISQKFSLATMTLLDLIGNIFGPVINTVFNALNAAVWTGIGTAAAAFIGSFLTGGYAWGFLQMLKFMISERAFTWGNFKTLINYAFTGGGFRGFLSGLGSALTNAGIALVSFLLADFLVVPWLNANLPPGAEWVANGVGGTMKGGVSSLIMFGSFTIAGHTIGTGLAATLGTSLGASAGAAGPLALAALPAGFVSGAVKHAAKGAGWNDWQAGAATILSGVGAGAATGAAFGLAGGPFAPITVPVGAAIGALVGGVAAAFNWFFGG